MAKVTPFGDAQAHGSICHTLTFRRFRNKVVMQHYPKPKQPNTPGQQAQKQKFKNCWKEYHKLDAWSLEYLRQKAVQENSSGSNIFMSQCLLDEVPSVVPMNGIKIITDLSLPVPVSTDTQGINFEFISVLDAGNIQTLMAWIFDNENAYNFSQETAPYTRLKIKISRTLPTEIIIPFNYPIICTWENFSDVEDVDLIRLPKIHLGQTTPPSTTPKTDLKTVNTLVINTPVGQDTDDIKFEIWTDRPAPSADVVVATIWDYENVLTPGAQGTPSNGMWIKITRTKSPDLTIPDGYSFNINWTDSNNNPYDNVIELPEVLVKTSGPPSTTVMNQVKQVIGANYTFLLNSTPPEYRTQLFAQTDPSTLVTLAKINDPTNVLEGWPPVAPYDRIRVVFWNHTADPMTIPPGYGVKWTWVDFSDVQHVTEMLLPEVQIPANSGILMFLADDFSLYYDEAMTQLAKSQGDNEVYLYIADDWSLYYDEALTELAKGNAPPPVELYVADDFSVYWDKEMTQLANSPYF